MATITPITPAMASGADAKGIVPPLLRAVTHIGFMLAIVSAEIAPDNGVPARPASHEELEQEADHIAQHWALVIRPAYLNEDVRNKMQAVTNMVPTLRESIRADNRQRLFTNLQAFLKSILAVSVLVDQSAFGLAHPADTDAGTTL